MTRLILGTAGHIDHGKTALVRALTGVDTDRLPEEKRRGITIDLGFARLPLDDGLELGVVDVPGHEAFVRNMLAGATGFDLAMLVIAADEGVMPQTREHLAIVELLGVRAGVVALSKTDLVDEEWLGLVLEDVRAQLASSTFAAAPIVPVSAVTHKGLPELREALRGAANDARLRPGDDLFRLPIDRAFTVHGTGTVVTGTVWSGTVRRDDALRLLPAGGATRARGVQVHGAEVQAAGAGQRAAIALGGEARDRAARGQVLVREPAWRPSTRMTARVRVIEGTDWELKQRQRVHFHLGTAELLGRVRLLDAERLSPGEEGWAQLLLEAPIVARAGDRFVLRSYSPVTTMGGGIICEPDAPPRKRIAAGEERLLLQLLEGPGSAVEGRTLLSGWSGVEIGRLAVETPHSPGSVASALAGLEREGQVRRVGERVFAAQVVAQARGALLATVERFHDANPLRGGIDREELRRALPAPGEVAGPLADALLEELTATGELAVRAHLVARSGFLPRLSRDQESARDRLVDVYQTAGLAPPSLQELPAELRTRADLWPLLKLLESEGRLLAMAPESYIASRSVDDARALLRERAADGRLLTPADFRELFPVSRKHLIPLLEFFDRSGVTVRRGNERYVLA